MNAVATLPSIAAADRDLVRRFESPALMFINGRGDYLHNLPVIRALAALFDGALTLVTRRSVREMFSATSRSRVCNELLDRVKPLTRDPQSSSSTSGFVARTAACSRTSRG